VTEAVPGERIVNDMDAGVRAWEVCTFVPEGAGTRFEIAMSSSVPDDLGPEAIEQLADGGRAQLRLELDNIKRLLEQG
jgi:hypothetical protein